MVDLPIDIGRVLVIDYTNHDGKRAWRRVVPDAIWFGMSEFHTGEVAPQWFLRGVDIDRFNADKPGSEKHAERDFKFTSIHETLTVEQWEKRAESDERWRQVQAAWRNAQT